MPGIKANVASPVRTWNMSESHGKLLFGETEGIEVAHAAKPITPWGFRNQAHESHNGRPQPALDELTHNPLVFNHRGHGEHKGPQSE